MSRICVKNIPKYLSEDKLREHFSAKGEVTDAKIIKTSDGYSRQFGFVGYRTEAEADEALRYFDQSYLDTCRLTCELAYPVGDLQIARPWSKYSEGSSAHLKIAGEVEEVQEKTDMKEKTSPNISGLKTDKNNKKKNETKGLEEVEKDPLLAEFLEVMMPAGKRKVWTNDVGEVGGTVQTGTAVRVKSKKQEGKKSKTKKKKLKEGKGESESEEDLYDNEVDLRQEAEHEEEDSENEEEESKVEVTDLEYLKSRTKADWSDDEEEEEEGIEDGEEESPGAGYADKDDKGVDVEVELENDATEELNGGFREEEDAGPHEVDAEAQESVRETGRLFVRNLSYLATEEDLGELFSQYGELSEVHLVLDRDTKKSKGFAYVLFMIPENAERAMKDLDLSIFQGRLLHIIPARKPPSKEGQPGLQSRGTGLTTQFKQEREEQRVANEAAGGTQAWSTLFMRQDTVAENVAKKYGIEKRELLNPEAADLAVRVALGETHIIAETKKGLEGHGVNVDVLESFVNRQKGSGARSNRVVLVKNLPFSATEADLIALFGKHGHLGRIVLPETKTLALVEFLVASDAKKAFKGLAYKRFQHVPLYLEWAPEGVLSLSTVPMAQKPQTPQTDPEVPLREDQVKRIQVNNELVLEDENEDSPEARSIFVKNLSFNTKEAGLKKHFVDNSLSGRVTNAMVKTKTSSKGKQLSAGFGFVEFESVESAKLACKQLQGSVLDGHALVLQLSHGSQGPRKERISKDAKKNQSTTKLIVRNVAFEATKKDLEQLFNPFGQVKSVRLPKKFDGSHRGFAFIEFMTKKEAENAFEALKSTHLYGRHLVLERAKGEEGLQELRAKTAAHFQATEDPGDKMLKRRKLSEVVEE